MNPGQRPRVPQRELWRAVTIGDIEVATQIIAAGGVDLAACNGVGENLLCAAVRLPDTAMLRLLLSHGVPADQPDKYRVTPIMIAAGMGSVEAMQVLLDAGADIHGRDVLDHDALFVAAASGQRDTLAFCLAQGMDLHRVTRDGNDVMLAAVRNMDPQRRLRMVEILIGLEVSVDRANSCGETPLFLAAVRQDPGVFDRLVGAGADPHRPNAQGDTPLARINQASTEVVDHRWRAQWEARHPDRAQRARRRA